MSWKLLPGALEGDLIATSIGGTTDLSRCETNNEDGENQHTKGDESPSRGLRPYKMTSERHTSRAILIA